MLPSGVLSMDFEDKKRKPNFTEDENAFLVSQVEFYGASVLTQAVDSSSLRVKNQRWQLIADAMNNNNSRVYRSPDDIKKKWKNMRAAARKYTCDMRLGLGMVTPVNQDTLLPRVVQLLTNYNDIDTFHDDPDEINSSSPVPMPSSSSCRAAECSGRKEDPFEDVKRELGRADPNQTSRSTRKDAYDGGPTEPDGIPIVMSMDLNQPSSSNCEARFARPVASLPVQATSQASIFDILSRNSTLNQFEEAGVSDDYVKRKPNFTEEENLFLVSQVEMYKSNVLSRAVDQSTCRLKDHQWQVIADKMNAKNPRLMRSTADLRKRWQNMLFAARRFGKDIEMGCGPYASVNDLPHIQRRILALINESQEIDSFNDGQDCTNSTSPTQLHAQAAITAEPRPQSRYSSCSIASGTDVVLLPLEVKKEAQDGQEGRREGRDFGGRREEREHISSSNIEQGLNSGSEASTSAAVTAALNRKGCTAVVHPGPAVLYDQYQAAKRMRLENDHPTQQAAHAQALGTSFSDSRVQQTSTSSAGIVHNLATHAPVPPIHAATPMNNTPATTAPNQSRSNLEEEIARERWYLERQKLELDLIQQREKWEWERRKLQLETEILTLQRQQIEIKLQKERQGF